jgi:hypothetical protein
MSSVNAARIRGAISTPQFFSSSLGAVVTTDRFRRFYQLLWTAGSRPSLRHARRYCWERYEVLQITYRGTRSATRPIRRSPTRAAT